MVSFFRTQASHHQCLFQFCPFCRFFAFFFTTAIFLPDSDRKCCNNTSVVTAHVDHVVGLGIFVEFQVFSFDNDVLDLLLNSFWISVGRLFPMILSVQRCETLYYQPMFHPITSLVSSVECVCLPTLVHSVPCPGLSSALKSPPMIGRYAISVVCCVFLDLSAYPEWKKDTLINLTRWWSTTIVLMMARSLMYSVSMICCRHFMSNTMPTPCLMSYFPAPMNMCFWCLFQISDLSGLHVSLINIASHL